MTEQELKAHAYDCILNIEMWQKELQNTHKEIEKAEKNPVVEPVVEPVEEVEATKE